MPDGVWANDDAAVVERPVDAKSTPTPAVMHARGFPVAKRATRGLKKKVRVSTLAVPEKQSPIDASIFGLMYDHEGALFPFDKVIAMMRSSIVSQRAAFTFIVCDIVTKLHLEQPVFQEQKGKTNAAILDAMLAQAGVPSIIASSLESKNKTILMASICLLHAILVDTNELHLVHNATSRHHFSFPNKAPHVIHELIVALCVIPLLRHCAGVFSDEPHILHLLFDVFRVFISYESKSDMLLLTMGDLWSYISTPTVELLQLTQFAAARSKEYASFIVQSGMAKKSRTVLFKPDTNTSVLVSSLRLWKALAIYGFETYSVGAILPPMMSSLSQYDDQVLVELSDLLAVLNEFEMQEQDKIQVTNMLSALYKELEQRCDGEPSIPFMAQVAQIGYLLQNSFPLPVSITLKIPSLVQQLKRVVYATPTRTQYAALPSLLQGQILIAAEAVLEAVECLAHILRTTAVTDSIVWEVLQVAKEKTHSDLLSVSEVDCFAAALCRSVTSCSAKSFGLALAFLNTQSIPYAVSKEVILKKVLCDPDIALRSTEVAKWNVDDMVLILAPSLRSKQSAIHWLIRPITDRTIRNELTDEDTNKYLSFLSALQGTISPILLQIEPWQYALMYLKGARVFLDPVSSAFLHHWMTQSAMNLDMTVEQPPFERYPQLISMFAEESFGDLGVASAALHFTAQCYPSQHRIEFYRGLESLLCKVPMDSWMVDDLSMFQFPNETEERMIEYYVSLLDHADAFKDANPKLFDIAAGHTIRYLFPGQASCKEVWSPVCCDLVTRLATNPSYHVRNAIIRYGRDIDETFKWLLRDPSWSMWMDADAISSFVQ